MIEEAEAIIYYRLTTWCHIQHQGLRCSQGPLRTLSLACPKIHGCCSTIRNGKRCFGSLLSSCRAPASINHLPSDVSLNSRMRASTEAGFETPLWSCKPCYGHAHSACMAKGTFSLPAITWGSMCSLIHVRKRRCSFSMPFHIASCSPVEVLQPLS